MIYYLTEIWVKLHAACDEKEYEQLAAVVPASCELAAAAPPPVLARA